MKVTQEKRPQSQIALNIEISADASKQAYEKVVRDLSRTIRLPGFRKGKVPRHILLQQLGPERIRAEALENLVQESINKAVEQAEIDAIGNYNVEPKLDDLLKTYKPGEPLAFAATMDISPAITLGDYQSLTIQAEETPYEPEKVDRYLDEQRARVAMLVPVEGRSAQRGDVVVVDYVGRLPGEGEAAEAAVIEGAEATDFELELESGKFLEDLITGIEGMSPDESTDIPVAFPEDYAREDLAGKQAIFTVTLKEIKEKELPDLDDEFAEEVSPYETLEEWRADLEERFQTQAQNLTQRSVEDAIEKALLTIAEIEFPDTLIDRETNILLQDMASQLEQYGLDTSTVMTEENLPELKAKARPDAIERLKVAYALREIAKQQNLEPDPEKLQERLKQIYEQLSGQRLDPERVKQFVTEELQEAQAMEWLRENLQIELVPPGTLTPESAETVADSESGAAAPAATATTVDVLAEPAEVEEETTQEETIAQTGTTDADEPATHEEE